MSQSRRNFMKSTTTAITLLTVSKASAESAARLIGFVHSTQLGTEASQCFMEALKYNGWQPGSASKPIRVTPKEANGQYGGTHGHGAIRNLVKQHGRVHLIASAGGVAAQRSALEELSGPIPFVYLSGRLPAPPDLPSSSGDGKYCGVILNTSGQYGDALRSFARLGVASDDVWLVQNYNSDMTQEEWLEWPSISNNNNRFRFFEPQPPPPLRPINNNEALFRSEVTRLSTLTPAPKGIVVSSDPFFRSKANEFTTAMSALRVPICSPFKDFPRSGNDFMLPGGATLSSSNIADTNTAFYQLGLRAADVLDNSTAASPIPATPRVSKKWNGTAWVDA